MEKGVPKMDGSGEGARKNKGRGGCNPPTDSGMGPKADIRGMGRGRRGRGIRVRMGKRGFGRRN